MCTVTIQIDEAVLWDLNSEPLENRILGQTPCGHVIDYRPVTACANAWHISHMCPELLPEASGLLEEKL